MNHKLSLYDDISEIIKEQIDSFEFDDYRGSCIQSINPMDMYAVMPAVIGGLNHNIIIADDIELAKMKEPGLIQFDCCKEEKQPKENHPYGWYRKFDKKRF